MKNIINVILILCSIIFVGCSKDKSTGEDENDNYSIGVFIDSYVSGLKYATETKRGITDENGNFEYLEGETVTFMVGNITIGSGIAKENMTPIDIVSGENANINSTEVKNIAAFLQSLDSDNDPSNGIDINEATVNAISFTSIDFSQPIEKTLGEIIAEVNLTNESNLKVIYPEIAALHLAESLGEEYEIQNLVFLRFTPTIENWIVKPSTSIYWIHETDTDGKLIASRMFEKYPNRIRYEQFYEEFNSMGMPTKYRLDLYHVELQYSESVEVSYNEDYSISGILTSYGGGNWFEDINFKLDEKLRVKEAIRYDENGNFKFRGTYTFLDNNNREIENYYISESGYDDGNLDSKVENFYSGFGEIEKVETQIYPEDYTITKIFEYREDHTLEIRKVNNPGFLTTGRTEESLFDEEEKIIKSTFISGDNKTEVSYNVDGVGTEIVENYYQEILYGAITKYLDGTSIHKTIEEDGSYKLEYRNADNSLTKTEFYDSDGNLVRTE